MRRQLASTLGLLLAVLLAAPAAAQGLLEGEFGDIDLGRQLLDPERFPTIQELRRAMREPQISAVMMLKLYHDKNNHFLPVWSNDGGRLAFQRSDVAANTSRVLLFQSLASPQPMLLGGESSQSYDYMFRWAVNGQSDEETPGSYVFARIEGAGTQVYVSLSGGEPKPCASKGQRHTFPALYERTDRIFRLIYSKDGVLTHEAFTPEGPVEHAISLARGIGARWSRDGRRLLYVRQRAAAGRGFSRDILLRDLKSGNETPLPAPRGGSLRSPVWSPDGRLAAYHVREAGANKPWRIRVVATEGKQDQDQTLGDDVVVNETFESEGPAFEPSGQRVWFFSHAQKRQAYYPLVAADVASGKTAIVNYPARCTNPNDLAVNPVTEIPEMAFVGHDGVTQDLFIVFLNHY